jgi:hypothetical protein
MTSGRVVGVLIAASVGLHLALSAVHWSASRSLATVTAVMALACLPCLRHLWRGPSPRDWLLTGVLAAVMLALHGPMLLTRHGAALSGTGSWWCTAGRPRHHALTLPGLGGVRPPSQHHALLLTALALAAAELGAALIVLARSAADHFPPRWTQPHVNGPASTEAWAPPLHLTRKPAR